MDMVQFGLDDYADRSLRDMADRDYIVARICYKTRLDQHFLWLAQQAMEKYFKAILLYNRVDSRALGHDLRKCMAAVQGISDLALEVPGDVAEYVGYLNDEGQCRYFEFPYVIQDYALARLDRAVWFFRRYCRQLRLHEGSDEEKASHLAAELDRIRARDESESVRAHWLHTGVLEKTLEDGDSELRRFLVWKNPLYGARRRRSITNYPRRLSGGNPAHYLQPDCFPELSRLVRFSPEVRDWITRRMNGEA